MIFLPFKFSVRELTFFFFKFANQVINSQEETKKLKKTNINAKPVTTDSLSLFSPSRLLNHDAASMGVAEGNHYSLHWTFSDCVFHRNSSRFRRLSSRLRFLRLS